MYLIKSKMYLICIDYILMDRAHGWQKWYGYLSAALAILFFLSGICLSCVLIVTSNKKSNFIPFWNSFFFFFDVSATDRGDREANTFNLKDIFKENHIRTHTFLGVRNIFNVLVVESKHIVVSESLFSKTDGQELAVSSCVLTFLFTSQVIKHAL